MNGTWYIYALESGVFSGLSYSGPADHLAENTPNGCGAAADVLDWRTQRIDLKTGALVDYRPPAPADDANRTWTWDDAGKRWASVPTLAAIKAARWEDIKGQRTERLGGTFPSAGRVFNVDPVNLTGAVMDAMLATAAGEPWTQLWVLADNSTVTLTAAEMIAVGRGCKAYVSGLWAISQGLRDKIESAQTADQVAAISWPA